jgi:hypothetical protein
MWAKIAVPVVVVIAIAAAASSGSDKDTTVKTAGTTVAQDDGATGAPIITAKTAQTTAVPAKSNYVVGDTAKTGDFEVTVYGFKDPQAPGQFDKPAGGSHFVSVDVQVANKGSKQQVFSSVIGFHLLDNGNRQYDEQIASSVKPGPPEGQVAAGEAVRGFVVFEVPDGSKGLRLRVQGNLTASGAFFTLG